MICDKVFGDQMSGIVQVKWDAVHYLLSLLIWNVRSRIKANCGSSKSSWND